ncbi:MAG: hypothetical protein ACRC41_15090 [Sarcina sp.]
MQNFLNFLGQFVNNISNVIWAGAMPIIIIVTLIIIIRMIFKVKNNTTKHVKVNIFKTLKNSIVVMGTVIGTGALIGVLGSLTSTAQEGQAYIEGVAMWGVIGLILLAPLAYSETLMSRILNGTTVDSVRKFFGKGFCNVYKVVFTIIFVFGFGGFQFSAINGAVNIVSIKTGIGILSNFHKFMLIVIPIMIGLSIIVLLRKQGLILKSLTTLTSISVTVYIIFFIMFFFKTYEYWPIFFGRMMYAMKNPFSMLLGVPLGLMVGLQKIMQVTDVGIGVYGMVPKDEKRSDREAALASAIVLFMLFIVGIFATTYITSFGVEHNLINLSKSSSVILTGYYNSAMNVTGIFGLIAVATFSILTGISALLGRYYFLTKIIEKSEKFRIFAYITILTSTGALAVYGCTVLFSVVDLFIFVAFAINLGILYKFTRNAWKNHIVRDIEIVGAKENLELI